MLPCSTPSPVQRGRRYLHSLPEGEGCEGKEMLSWKRASQHWGGALSITSSLLPKPESFTYRLPLRFPFVQHTC